MIIEMPGTTAAAIGRRLVQLREQQGAVALGRVLNLVIVTHTADCEAAVDAANHASHEHPCRIIVVSQSGRRGGARLDGQIRVGGDAGASEVLVLTTSGELTEHPESVVLPLLLPDTPVVVWWPAEAPAVPADDPVGRLSRRRITDVAACRSPGKALEQRVASYRPGDTDLAWSRITLWRGILAAALDQQQSAVTEARVEGAATSPSADLLAGWLAQTLRVPVRRVRRRGVDGLLSVHLQLRDGPVDLVRPEQDDVALLRAPGQPEREVALPKRPDRDCLAEELRRLDEDEVYGETLVEGLARLQQGSA